MQTGETHQGIFDLSFLSTIPNINIMAPRNFLELEKMLEFALNLNEPVVIRYPRGRRRGCMGTRARPVQSWTLTDPTRQSRVNQRG